ncbi:hypothetical protein E2320_022110, partial [Naja naja]
MTGLPLLLLLLLFWLLAPTIAKRMQTGCVLTNILQSKRDFHRPVLSNKTISTSGEYFLGVGFEFTQGDRMVYPSFIWINPKEVPQYEGLVQLLLHFQWNWVGLLAPEDDRGERFISSLMPMLKEKEICLAFTEKLKSNFLTIPMLKILHIFETWSKAEVIVLFGDPNSITNVQVAMSVHEHLRKTSFWKVWILTSHWKLSVVRNQDILKAVKPFHGALNFRHHTGDVSEFSHFLLSLDPLKPQGDVFLLLCWE